MEWMLKFLKNQGRIVIGMKAVRRVANEWKLALFMCYVFVLLLYIFFRNEQIIERISIGMGKGGKAAPALGKLKTKIKVSRHTEES